MSKCGRDLVEGVDQAVVAGQVVSCSRTGRTGETQIG
jgi:hypothetical protein